MKGVQKGVKVPCAVRALTLTTDRPGMPQRIPRWTDFHHHQAPSSSTMLQLCRLLWGLVSGFTLYLSYTQPTSAARRHLGPPRLRLRGRGSDPGEARQACAGEALPRWPLSSVEPVIEEARRGHPVPRPHSCFRPVPSLHLCRCARFSASADPNSFCFRRLSHPQFPFVFSAVWFFFFPHQMPLPSGIA